MYLIWLDAITDPCLVPEHAVQVSLCFKDAYSTRQISLYQHKVDRDLMSVVVRHARETYVSMLSGARAFESTRSRA